MLRQNCFLVLVSFLGVACGPPLKSTFSSSPYCSSTQHIENGACVDNPVFDVSITSFFEQKSSFRYASQLYVDKNPNPGKCYVEGSLSIAASTYSDSQTQALLEGSVPVGAGWYLIISGSTGSTWRASCTSSWELGGTKAKDISFDIDASTSACGIKAHYLASSGKINVGLGRIDADGKNHSNCIQRGSVTFSQKADGTLIVKLNALMEDKSSVSDLTFEVSKVFNPSGS